MKFGQRIKSEEAACLAGHRIELADHFLDYKVFDILERSPLHLTADIVNVSLAETQEIDEGQPSQRLR
jgi:hypothetical protein